MFGIFLECITFMEKISTCKNACVFICHYSAKYLRGICYCCLINQTVVIKDRAAFKKHITLKMDVGAHILCLVLLSLRWFQLTSENNSEITGFVVLVLVLALSNLSSQSPLSKICFSDICHSAC